MEEELEDEEAEEEEEIKEDFVAPDDPNIHENMDGSSALNVDEVESVRKHKQELCESSP